MVDIHSHILPYIDDGASSIDEAFEMLRIASDFGTDTIVLTPHINLYEDSKNFAVETKAVFDAFMTKVEDEHLDIDIVLGGEIFCNKDAISYIKQKLFPTINGSRFVLVEFDFFASSRYMANMLKQISIMGYVPIVAHPERYECVKTQFSVAMDFINSGALLQINKGSLLGDFGITARDTAFELINHRLAHFVASDAHTTSGRNPNLEFAYDIVSDEFDTMTAKKLFDTNPRAVINNEKLVISRPIL